MTSQNLYEDIIELIRQEAELDNFTFLSTDTFSELHTDFPPAQLMTSGKSTLQQEVSNSEPQSPVATQTTGTACSTSPSSAGSGSKILPQTDIAPQKAKAATPQPAEEARPIPAANVDLSSLTAETLTTANKQIYNGEHFSLSQASS